MASKLIPPNPSEVMVIRQITPNIITCSMPFSRYGLLKIGLRGTLVLLSSGSIAVFSAPPLTPEVKTAISTLGNGTVRYLIAPNAEHYLFLADWHTAFPEAKIIAPATLSEKLSSLGSKVPIAHSIPSTTTPGTLKLDEELDKDFEAEFVGGVPNELVLHYLPDRTLLVADLLFNLPCVEQYSLAPEPANTGLLSRTFNGARGTTGGALTWQKRILWAIAAKDRKGFGESVGRIARWGFDRIIPCHGEVVETEGGRIWGDVFAGHLSPAPTPTPAPAAKD